MIQYPIIFSKIDNERDIANSSIMFVTLITTKQNFIKVEKNFLGEKYKKIS